MINHRVYDAISEHTGKLGSFAHGFTYSGHPVSAAVALETLKIYEERDIVGQVRAQAPGFAKGIQRFNDHPLVGETRSVGLIGAVELVRDKQTKEIFDPKLGVARLLREAGAGAWADHPRHRQQHRLLPAPGLDRGGDRGDVPALRPRPRRDLGLGQGAGPRQRGVKPSGLFPPVNRWRCKQAGRRGQNRAFLPRLDAAFARPLTGC